MLKRFLKLLEELFGGDALIGADGLEVYEEQKEPQEEMDEPLDCTGFYLSNTQTNYGKSDFHRY